MNKHDAERITGILLSEGWKEEDAPTDADAVIFLTCSVRNSAENRFFGKLSSYKNWKSERKERIVAVGGCAAQRYGEELLGRFKHIDFVFGTQSYTDIGLYLKRAIGKTRFSEVEMRGLELKGSKCARKNAFRSWIPVTLGCDNNCAYCVVPPLRGHLSSRPIEEIEEEFASVVSEGAREINLIGQNVNAYGVDIYGKNRFHELLITLDRIAQEDTWIRFATSHPKDLSGETIDAVAELESVCEHFHLPLQAGSDRVLEQMRRGYTVESYKGKVEEIRRKVKGALVSSDIIVGFPGETEEDFEMTLKTIKNCNIDHCYTFKFNAMESTDAHEMNDWIDKETVDLRFKRLIETVSRLTEHSNRAYCGRVVKTMIVSIENQTLKCRTRSNRSVIVQEAVGCFDCGEIIGVEIIDSGIWSLRGKLP